MRGREDIVEDQDFALFVRKVKERLGIDLAMYKEQQMKRRLTALRQKRGFLTFSDFFENMMKDRELLYEFLDRMTINVSEFWRNRNRWEVLENRFLPEMLSQSPRLKCWSAACSTGEEPYTLAMILARKKALHQAEIVASDIDEGALEKARQGVYGERALKEVPADYLETYFEKEGPLFRVKDILKQAVKFKKQNLLSDPFEEQYYDLIICRNVIIYFTKEAKEMLYHKFSRALKPGGILFVGSTEQIFAPEQYGFQPADTFFYRKRLPPGDA